MESKSRERNDWSYEYIKDSFYRTLYPKKEKIDATTPTPVDLENGSVSSDDSDAKEVCCSISVSQYLIIFISLLDYVTVL